MWIGDPDHVGVVFDDEHGVALIAELAKDVDQPLVVARVQADRRLVEHVERADQRRAERRREVDALRFAARQRRRQAIERAGSRGRRRSGTTAAGGFPQHLVGDRALPSRQLQRRRRTACASRTVSADTWSIVRPADADVARLAPQPRAAAVGAGEVAAISAQEHADVDLYFLRSSHRKNPRTPSNSPSPSTTKRFSASESSDPRERRAGAWSSRRALQLGQLRRGSAACSTARSRPAAIDFDAIRNDQIHVELDDVAEAVTRVGQAPNGLLNENNLGCGSRR